MIKSVAAKASNVKFSFLVSVYFPTCTKEDRRKSGGLNDIFNKSIHRHKYKNNNKDSTKNNNNNNNSANEVKETEEESVNSGFVQRS